MSHHQGWVVSALGAVALLFSTSGQAATGSAPGSGPAHVEPIEGSPLSKIRLTARAADRLGLETAVVRSETVPQMRNVIGEIVEPSLILASKEAPLGQAPDPDPTANVPRTTSESLFVRVRIPSEGHFDLEEPARILPLNRTAEVGGFLVKAVTVDPNGETADTIPYQTSPASSKLSVGQRVHVELLIAGKEPRIVIPYSSIIYDEHGRAWVYTSPEPLVYVRHPVEVDFIEGDLAVLHNGPPLGTSIVTVGIAELYGTEFGIDH